MARNKNIPAANPWETENKPQPDAPTEPIETTENKLTVTVGEEEAAILGITAGDHPDENETPPQDPTPPSEPVISAAITEATEEKRSVSSKLGEGDQIPVEVLNLISGGKTLKEALKIYNSKQK